MNATILKAVKNGAQAAFDGLGCSDALENALVAANARFWAQEGWSKVLDRLENALWMQARALVGDFNATVGADVLYLAQYADMWVLYGRPDAEAADKRLLWGCADVDGLARLVLRLENGMRGAEACGASGTPERRGVEDVAPYKKERVNV